AYRPCTLLADLGEQRELAHVVAALAVGQPRRIGAREAGVAELRRLAVAPRLADGAIETVDGQEAEAVDLDMGGHLRDRHPRGDELRLLRRVDAVEAGV